MTINALQSLQKHTPRGSIGIVIPPDKNFDQIKELILNSLVNHDKIHFVVGKIHFENWNPTQHKLDICMFCQQFNPVIWIDSDVFVLKDLVPFAESFFESKKAMAVLSDHVNRDQLFVSNWEDGPDKCFVPQACYMLFRSDMIPNDLEGLAPSIPIFQAS
ncbi:MAG: hypothetical protein EZS28_029511 [Streblomastix strix]|uniref:Uncharacterized protein n=1 Tax=Streblomastix strix TaxID=222440 RepID=A0A5J4UXF5_9EUKA|nr:MAG: hypothetical protein EZS28_029511 [Streblomastix strix]